MTDRLEKAIVSLNSVAMGDKKADLVLKGCNLVNVYTREIIPDSQIAIVKDRIAYVGPDASHTVGPKTAVMDIEGRYVTPGFADPHVHIDQLVTPAELAKVSLLCGVTSLFSDPIDIVSVCGKRGFDEFCKMGESLPIRIFQVVPGGLPVDPKFSHGKTMNHSQQNAAVKRQNVLGMGEVFSWTKVVLRDSKTIKSLYSMLEGDCIINGHTAGASEKKLNSYVSSGILSCHEPINFEQVIERLRLGMWIMIREGSIRRDIKDIVPSVLARKIYTDRLMFCSDGVDPIDLKMYGHIDHCIREAVKHGMEPIDAVAIASKNNFDYYNMGKDLGGIAPGKLADILVFDDLESFKPKKVFVGGKLVASNGSIVARVPQRKVPSWIKNTVKLKKFSERDFAVRYKGYRDSVVVNTISLATEIITKLDSEELPIKDGNVLASKEKDVWKVAAFDRTFGTKKHTVGFLKNLGADIGAFASTWSFHENDLIVIGSNEKDMATAANNLAKSQGGMTVVTNGATDAHMPLQIAGIISTDSFAKSAENFEKISNTIVDAGCKFKRPHLIPLFLPFLALPSVRILYGGVVDVKRRQLVPVFAQQA